MGHCLLCPHLSEGRGRFTADRLVRIGQQGHESGRALGARRSGQRSHAPPAGIGPGIVEQGFE